MENCNSYLRFHSNELFEEDKLALINKWYKDRDVPLEFWTNGKIVFSKFGEFPAYEFAIAE